MCVNVGPTLESSTALSIRPPTYKSMSCTLGYTIFNFSITWNRGIISNVMRRIFNRRHRFTELKYEWRMRGKWALPGCGSLLVPDLRRYLLRAYPSWLWHSCTAANQHPTLSTCQLLVGHFQSDWFHFSASSRWSEKGWNNLHLSCKLIVDTAWWEEEHPSLPLRFQIHLEYCCPCAYKSAWDSRRHSSRVWISGWRIYYVVDRFLGLLFPNTCAKNSRYESTCSIHKNKNLLTY